MDTEREFPQNSVFTGILREFLLENIERTLSISVISGFFLSSSVISHFITHDFITHDQGMVMQWELPRMREISAPEIYAALARSYSSIMRSYSPMASRSRFMKSCSAYMPSSLGVRAEK